MILIYDYQDIYNIEKKFVNNIHNFYEEIAKQKYKILIINYDFLYYFLELKYLYDGYTIFVYSYINEEIYKNSLFYGDFFYTYDELWKLYIRLDYLKRKLNLKNVYKIGDFVVDLRNNQIYKNKNPIKISKAEFEILKVLLQNNNRFLSKYEILDLVDYINSIDSLKVLISKLRNLGFDIETKKNVGYKINLKEKK